MTSESEAMLAGVACVASGSSATEPTVPVVPQAASAQAATIIAARGIWVLGRNIAVTIT